ncbi:Multi-glycosylated core protein 24 (MGC-24) [Nesidiocoris tenuis]|uniref:Multi-glycosylated core protein 24 (MGC-24) n=1 Tax=Nesidiocoris tenuis TaxID=355587 RepID=A0ABN7B8G3_9HEMI|nr:Multi-glycosylated core protein 24 (MGC-24) [Nesidiocoris tenuis]
MYKFVLSVLLFACVAGQLAWTADTKIVPNVAIDPPQPHTNGSTTPAPPPTSNGTTIAPTSSTTPAPTSSSTSPTSPKPTVPPSPSPTQPPTTSPPSPKPSPQPKPVPPPSDRKFDAFSFIGGFALAVGLTAIGFLAWKLYISRRDSVYHTL